MPNIESAIVVYWEVWPQEMYLGESVLCVDVSPCHPMKGVGLGSQDTGPTLAVAAKIHAARHQVYYVL